MSTHLALTEHLPSTCRPVGVSEPRLEDYLPSTTPYSSTHLVLPLAGLWEFPNLAGAEGGAAPTAEQLQDGLGALLPGLVSAWGAGAGAAEAAGSAKVRATPKLGWLGLIFSRQAQSIPTVHPRAVLGQY